MDRVEGRSFLAVVLGSKQLCHWEREATLIFCMQKPLNTLQLCYCRLHIRNSFSGDPLTLLIIQEVTWLTRTIFLWLLLLMDSPKSASPETEKKNFAVPSLWVPVVWSCQCTLQIRMWVVVSCCFKEEVNFWAQRSSAAQFLAISDVWLIAGDSCVRAASAKLLSDVMKTEISQTKLCKIKVARCFHLILSYLLLSVCFLLLSARLRQQFP